MKARDGSEEVEGRAGNAAAPLATDRVSEAAPGRSASGVVAAPSRGDDDDEDKTTVDHGGVALSREQQAALARRIRSAMENTLPLGTPVPQFVGSRAARSAFSRTMLLAGRPVPGVAIAPGAKISEAPPPQLARPPEAELITPAVPIPAVVAPAPAPLASEPPPSEAAVLRASFVRSVGPPMAPPPRRSRRPGASERDPASERLPSSERAPGSEPDHEAFALDRPLTVPPPVPATVRGQGLSVSTARAAEPGTASSPLSAGLMLPPPPQPGDYEPAPPAAVALVPGGFRESVLPPSQRVTQPPLLTDLPSANPFEGFEAPRESFGRRLLIVLVVAMAVVGVFALVAIALGFLGKTPHW